MATQAISKTIQQLMNTVIFGHDPRGVLGKVLTDKETDWQLARDRGWHSLFQMHCRQHRGVGLAANQVGIEENFFFVAASVKMPKMPNGGLCINPSYMPLDPSAPPAAVDEEGCLSLPGRRFWQPRYPVIMARWTNTSGHIVEAKLKGFAARVFQHEYDHLRGLTLLDTSLKELHT